MHDQPFNDQPFIELRATAGDEGRRLDRILRKALPRLPLSRIHRLLREGKIRVDGRRASPGDRISAGQIIRVPAEGGDTAASGIAGTGQESPDIIPGLIFESPDILALNKPAGMLVHGPDSLDTRVRAYLAPRLPPSLSFTPGPLHRLDKPTSGVVVFSASLRGARLFSALLREHSLVKRYLALVEGPVTGPGIWEDELRRDTDLRKTLPAGDGGGKSARTRFKPRAWGGGFPRLELDPDTGRSHLIRAQAALRGHPLAGDRKYGGRTDPASLVNSRGKDRGGGGISFLLHAWQLEIPPNSTPEGNAGERPILPALLEAPVPDYFQETLLRLFGERR
jgi:23S rRNA pseudouridine955/2504/2580 synthase